MAEVTIYHWKWYYSAPGLIMWLVLVLALVLPKSNHNWNSLLIIIPLLIVNGFWLAFKEAMDLSSVTVVQFGTIVQSVTVGTAALWLVGGYFTELGGFARFLLSLMTMLLVAGSGILSYSTEYSNETVLLLALFLFATFTVLAAIAATRTVCKGRYRPGRFMLWLALWMLLFSMLTMFVFYIAGSYIMSGRLSRSWLSQSLVMILVPGPVVGLGLYLLNLPFMILGLANPFFRKRLCGCLSLKPTPASVMSSSIDNIA